MTTIGRRGFLGALSAGSIAAATQPARAVTLSEGEIAADPSPAGFARALQSACDALGPEGGLVTLPAGRFAITAPPESAVGPDEGDCVRLTERHGEVTVAGEGLATVIAPVSNRLVLFSLAGARGLTLRDLHFDNSADGALTGTAKPASGQKSFEPNGGVREYGNGANAVVRQFHGANARFFGVRSTGFHTLCAFRGAGADEARLEGHLVADHVEFFGGSQAFLCAQPEVVRLDNLYGEDIAQSINDDGSNDPGHLLYVTNRPGAVPKVILVDHVSVQRCESTPIKVNKGEVVTIGEYAFDDVAGGLEFRRVMRLAVGPGSMRLTEIGRFRNDEGILIQNCGEFSLTGPLIDRREADAWGINVQGGRRRRRSDGFNRGGVIDAPRILSDHTHVGEKRAAITVKGQDRLIIRSPMTVLFGANRPRRPRIAINDSRNVAVLDPVDQIVDSRPRGTLVRFDEACKGGVVRYTPALVDAGERPGAIVDQSGSATVIQQ